MYESRRSIIRDETSNGVRAGLLFDPKNLADAKSGFGRAAGVPVESIFNRTIFSYGSSLPDSFRNFLFKKFALHYLKYLFLN